MQKGDFHGFLKPPPDFKLMLLCVQAVTAKGHLKCNVIGLHDREKINKQVSGYKQCCIYKNQSLEVSK